MKLKLLSASTGVFGYLVVACTGKSFHDVGDLNAAVSAGPTGGVGSSGPGLNAGGAGDGSCSLGGGGLGGMRWGWSAGGPSFGVDNGPCSVDNGCVVDEDPDFTAFTGDSRFFYGAHAGTFDLWGTPSEYGFVFARDVAKELVMGLGGDILHSSALFLTSEHLFVYYEVDGRPVLGRVPRFGCKLIEVVQLDATPSVDGGEPSRTAFVADGSTGYFLMPGAVHRIAVEDSAATVFLSADATSLSIDSGFLYFTTLGAQPESLEIWRAALDGGAPELVTTDGLPSLQASQGTLYALEHAEDQVYLVSMPASGGSWTRLADFPAGSSPSHLQVVGNRYYRDSFPEDGWELFEGTLDDPGSSRVLLSVDDANVKGWHGTDAGVYWARQWPDGSATAYFRQSP